MLAFFVPVVGIPMLVLVALVTWALKSAQHQVTGNPGTPPAETEPSARMARSAMQPSSAANRTAYDLFMAHTAGNTVLAHTHFPLTIEGAGRDVVARIDSLLSAPGKINPRECRELLNRANMLSWRQQAAIVKPRKCHFGTSHP